MSERNDRPRSGRPHRGRPRGRDAGGRRRAAPTRARLLAVRVLERIERTRAYADLALHGALSRSDLPGPDRALATELVYGTLRWRGSLDYVLSQVLDRDLAKLEPVVLSILRTAAYQLVRTDRIPVSAAVDQAVRCTRAAGASRAAGLVNAVLRRLAEAREGLEWPDAASDPIGHLTHALSLPTWLAERWVEEFGIDEAVALAAASNAVPPRAVRANRRRTNADALLAALLPDHPGAHRARFAPDGVVLEQRGHPGSDPLFMSGQYTVQDEASQLVVELLDPQPGERVLDACAAPGAKTTAIAERVGDEGSVVALDRHPRRLGLVRRDARRLGVPCIETHERDASRPLGDLGLFDRVLVDAPCSGLGTLRRNPDARWRIQPRDVGRLAELQRAILRQAATVLRPGGTLVYSTCTVLPEENQEVVEAFLEASPGFRRAARASLPARLEALLDEQGSLRTLPHRHEMDGFFAARIERDPSAGPSDGATRGPSEESP
ncbi:MAG TPA: 16S rRNA (cytosine(967)-C(5))-methyltransferase RsmB [Myxococcota bacterium]|nr:16S rRNA (cytosine(967)-C(5))-methyltransferase RsmB [Myxococcota bacterium]